MNQLPIITLRHLLIDKSKCIGLQFFPHPTLHALVKTLDSVKWSAEFSMVYVPNKKKHFHAILATFKGIAWLNCRYFFRNKPVHTNAEATDLSPVRNQIRRANHALQCQVQFPSAYIEHLELKRYSLIF